MSLPASQFIARSASDLFKGKFGRRRVVCSNLTNYPYIKLDSDNFSMVRVSDKLNYTKYTCSVNILHNIFSYIKVIYPPVEQMISSQFKQKYLFFNVCGREKDYSMQFFCDISW